MKKIWFLLFLPFYFFACEDENNPVNSGEEQPIHWSAAADSSSTALITSFWNASGKYFNTDNHGNQGFQYWPQAHALDVLIDAYVRTGNNTYKNYIDQWFEGVRIKNGNRWWNEYYDDMEWIALALLRAYDATQETKFKDAAMEIWGYIKTGWNDQAGGGIAWKSDQPWSKNACSNGPASILAARLYQRFQDEADQEWAFKIYNWEKETLFNAQNGAIDDNIDARTNKIGDWKFTYNQGTFIGTAIELFKITNEKAYLNDAVLAANYTLGSLVNSSDALLKDEGGGDGGLFKGIFIRYFVELIQQERLDASDKKRYLQFFKHNAETLWTAGTYKQLVLFSPYWKRKPTAETGLTEQESGCMLIEGAATILK
jgi:predicted alpha-1,6-mannanase (GH76 family)